MKVILAGLVAAGLFASVPAAAAGSANPDSALEKCRDRAQSDDDRIAACSVVIDSGIDSGKEGGGRLAEAYYERCLSYNLRSDRAALNAKNDAVSPGEDDNARALKDCNRAIALKPDYADAFVTRGLIAKGKKDSAHAIADFSRAIALKPDDFFAYAVRGDAYAQTGDYDHAIADCSYALKKGFVIGGFAKYCLDEANTAKTRLASGQKLGDPRAWCDGKALAQEGFPTEKQIEGCTRLIESGHESHDALVKDYFNRASANEFGDYAKAIEDYKMVVTLKPDYADAYGGLANVYWLNKQYDLAIPNFDKAIALKGSRMDMYYPYRGRSHAALGQYAAAIADLTVAIADNPSTDNLVERSAAYLALGDTAHAIADATAALAASARYGGASAAYDARGDAYFHKGDFASALADYSQSLKVWPQDSKALYGRGAARSRTGDKKGGAADMDAAVKLTEDIAATEGKLGIAP